MARYRLSMTTCCVLLIFAALLRGQFNDNRRRQDLSPVTLPGGSRIEFGLSIPRVSECLRATVFFSRRLFRRI